MRIEIFCSSCKRELKIDDSNITSLRTLQLYIQPCHSKQCYVCTDCEEVEAMKKMKDKLEKARKKLKEMEEIINETNND